MLCNVSFQTVRVPDVIWFVCVCVFQTLCAMLEMEVIENQDMKMQMITTLQTTADGKRMYAELCDRQIALRELVKPFLFSFGSIVSVPVSLATSLCLSLSLCLSVCLTLR